MAFPSLSAGQNPWRNLSSEELEKQYSPSRWVIRTKPEEVVGNFVQIGSQGTVGLSLDTVAAYLGLGRGLHP